MDILDFSRYYPTVPECLQQLARLVLWQEGNSPLSLMNRVYQWWCLTVQTETLWQARLPQSARELNYNEGLWFSIISGLDRAWGQGITLWFCSDKGGSHLTIRLPVPGLPAGPQSCWSSGAGDGIPVGASPCKTLRSPQFWFYKAEVGNSWV